MHEFLAGVSKSDESIEANLSTIFQSVRGTNWFHRSSELKCMLREYGSPTLFITFSCAEYDSEHISRYLRKVNDQPDMDDPRPLVIYSKHCLKHSRYVSILLTGVGKRCGMSVALNRNTVF